MTGAQPAGDYRIILTVDGISTVHGPYVSAEQAARMARRHGRNILRDARRAPAPPPVVSAQIQRAEWRDTADPPITDFRYTGQRSEWLDRPGAAQPEQEAEA